MIKKLIPIAALGLATVLLPSCRKALDINTNPNVAQNVTPSLLLTNAELQMGTAMGVDLQIFGSIWAEHWTQWYLSSQYKRIEQYQPDASDFDRVWNIFYAGTLMDLKKMDQIAAQTNMNQYRAISKLLMAYNFQAITDGWGDVPFTQALQGDNGITSPIYDDQAVVYAGLLGLVDSGMALIDPSDPNLPAGDDLIYGGDMIKWMRFGNTLKLKILLRMSEVNPTVAQQGIEDLYDSGAEFIGTDIDDDAMIRYISTAGNNNPLYSEMTGLSGTQNIIASATSVDSFYSNFDRRVFAFYIPTSSGAVAGVQQGLYNATSGTPYSPASDLVGAYAADPNSALAPVKFITTYESYLLQAEAVARGWTHGAGDAQSLFEAAIYDNYDAYAAAFPEETLRDSFDGVPISAATIFTLTPEYAAYAYIHGDTLTGFIGDEDVTLFNSPASYWGTYPTGGTVQEQVRHIITQKWFCMNGNQGFEAWTEYRRTGYPDFLVISANSRIGDVFPARFFYPSGELTTNLNFPGQPLITEKVWWDTH